MSTRTMETVEVDAKIKALAEKAEWTAEDAAEVIAAWRACGATLAAFARAHGTHAQRIRNVTRAVPPGARVTVEPEQAASPDSPAEDPASTTAPPASDAAHQPPEPQPPEAGS